MTTLYDILEIKPNASEQEIKKAYYCLSKKYHPDKCKEKDACQKFQEINYAYQVLMDEKTRKEYLQIDQEQKTRFQSVLEKYFNNNLKISELKSLGIDFSKNDWDYLDTNFKGIFNSINFKELFELITKGIIPKVKKNNSVLCSDSDINFRDESQAEYYFDLPIKYQKPNKLDIKLILNLSLADLIKNDKRKIKIKRKLEDEEQLNNYVFNLDKPYIVFVEGGDMDDGDYGNLIIQLCLPKNFYWKENLIFYEYPVSLYQMVYGLDVVLELAENKKIEYKNYVPSRDGFLINVDNVNIKNQYFAIKLVLDYEDTNEKEEILKMFFNN